MSHDPSSALDAELAGVTKRYGKQTALRDLSLRLPSGTCLGLIGPNGAGKTTMIKTLMGLLRPDAGEVSVLGMNPLEGDVAVKQRVGYVPEQQFIYRWMRVDEAVAFCKALYPRWNDKLYAELMALFALAPDKKVKQMSKGMVVKLSLLLAMSHEPELLILDEPMAGLDPLVREELLDGILQSLCDREQTVLFSSHTLADVQRLASTIGILYDGRLLVHDSVDALTARTKRIRAVLRDGAAPSTPPEGVIRQRVRDREWLVTVDKFTANTVEQMKSANRIEQVEVIDLGLEDVFKDYVRGWRTSA